MLSTVYQFYARLFARNCFTRWNKFLFGLSLRGLGYYNYQNSDLTGESYFRSEVFANNGAKVIFDVGANVGEYSIGLCKNNSAAIFSFEASPVTYKTLKENISKHPNIQAYQYAISDVVGDIELFDYEGSAGSSHASVYKEVIQDYHKSAAQKFSVKTTTIDDFAQTNSIDFIDLLKIDVEGHELNVLSGCKHLLTDRKIGMIQFEFTQLNSISRIFFKDIYDLLNENYEIFRLLPRGLLKIGTYSPTDLEIFAFSNYAAILKEKL